MSSENKSLTSMPTNSAEMLALRKALAPTNINDTVDSIAVKLINDPSFRALLSGTSNSSAVEGSIHMDNGQAAMMIRAYADKHGHSHVAKAKLADIVTALNVVLRRYGLDRRTRRNTVGGEFVSEAAE